MRLLPYVMVFGLGEALASQLTAFAAIWPFLAWLALLSLCFGFGFALRGWPLLFLFLLGLSVHFATTQRMLVEHRDHPWLIGREQRQRSPLSALKTDLSKRMAIGLEHAPDLVGLNRAILLGERARLSWATKQMFVESGTIHVFAISGLHVMVIARLLITGLFVISIRWRGVVALPVIWGYVVMIGAPPSAVRAAIMASCYFLAPVFWRRPDMVTSWSLAFLALHLARPEAISNVGSQLSFAVMLSLALAAEAMRGVDGWRKVLAMTCAAWLAGVPISACVFGRITPGGILANLVLIGAASWSVSMAMIGVGVSYISAMLASYCNNFAALCTGTMAGVAAIVSRLPGANFEIERWTVAMSIEGYVVFALVGYLIYRLRKHRVL